MERQLPKNVRQIGNVSDTPKIYVEDYVDTFFSQLCEKAGEMPIGAFLVGDMQKTDEDEYVYIYGAIQMHELKYDDSGYVIDEDTWKRAYEDCKQYFEDGEMLGWFVAHSGVELKAQNSTMRLHKKSFPKKNTIFIMKDPVEKEEIYYAHKFNDLMEIGGHYTYYEKNPCMQNYMISCRKKNGVSPTETVEDRAAKDFRSIVNTRGDRQKQIHANRLMQGVSACLVLIVIVMGVVMVNNFDKMKDVQSALSDAVDKTADAKDAEVKETSGAVTAVTGENSQADNTDAANGQTADAVTDGQAADAGADGQAIDANADAQAAGASAEGQAAASTDGQTADAQTGSTDGIYVVEQGDTLAIISKKMYGDVSHVDAICRMNGLTDGNLIYIGQKLLLP